MFDTGVDPDRTPSAANYGLAEHLQELNPFVDDRVCLTEFFKFRQLPIEIRYKVYDQYFLDDSSTLSSRSWPAINIDTAFMYDCFGPEPVPFAPDLCLVDRASRTEVIAFVTRFATFSSTLNFGTMRLIGCLQRPTLAGELKTLEGIRKLSLGNLNGCSAHCEGEDEESQDAEEARTKESCEHSAQVLPKFTGICTLDLEFCAPVFRPFFGFQSDYEAAPIDRFIKNFNIGCIMTLRGLQKITIHGVSGSRSWKAQVSHPVSVSRNETREHLGAVLKMAEDLKKRLEDEGRNVEVRVRLVYADQEEDIEV